MNKLYRFYNELKRRNVIKAGISYLVVSWVLLQVVALIGGIVKAPEWLGQTLLITLVILLPIWLIISWYYELTPDGIQKTKNVPKEESITGETNQKLNHLIIAFLAIAVILLFVDRFRIQKNKSINTTELISEIRIKNSIVVLPFEDLSPDKNYEYFVDGLAEEFLNSLTEIPEFKVTSRTSSFAFKNQMIDIPSIAQKLGVNYLVEGSVRTADSLIRVTIKLIDIEQDKSIWSNSWDQKMKNIFEIQNSIAESVARNLDTNLNESSLPKAIETDPEAYNLYLEAKFWLQKNRDDKNYLQKANDLLHQSFEIDSTYAPAWALLSNIYRLQSDYGLPLKEGYQKSKQAAERSIELDPRYALGYSALSNIVLESDWDFQAAHSNIQKALDLEPNNPEIIDNAGGIALVRGELKKAVELNEISVILDPVSMVSQYNLGLAYYLNRQPEKAENSINKSLELQPDQLTAHYLLSLIYLDQNRLDEAISVISKEPFEGWRLHSLSMSLWANGNKEVAQEKIDQIIQNYPGDLDYQLAQTYAYWGEVDKSFEWLEKAYGSRNFSLVEMQHDPILAGLHKDQRWDVFLRKMKLIE